MILDDNQTFNLPDNLIIPIAAKSVEAIDRRVHSRRDSNVECDAWFEILFHHEEHEGHEERFRG